MSLISKTTHCFSCAKGELQRVPTNLSRNPDLRITKPAGYDELANDIKHILKAEAQAALTGHLKDVCNSCGAIKYTDFGSGQTHYVRGLPN